MIDVSRRRFFGFIAAPAIVHVGNLMPIKAPPLIRARFSDWRDIVNPPWRNADLTALKAAFDESFRITRERFSAAILDPDRFPLDIS